MSDNETTRNKSKDIDAKNRESKDTGIGSSNANEKGPSKMMNEKLYEQNSGDVPKTNQ